MFGFLKPACGDDAYRRIYARSCQSLRQLAGLTALPLLSFEAVFLQSLITDAGWCDTPPLDAPVCCRLRTRRAELSTDTNDFERFTAAFGMLLVSIKLDDDIADERSWKARLLSWKLRPAVNAARSQMKALDAEFDQRLQQFLAEHAAVETDVLQPDWERFKTPTASAFAYVFGLASRVVESDEASSRCDWLERIGAEIGSAILAFDCAVDWEADQRNRQFNPLRSQPEAEQMLRESELSLARAAWVVEERMTEDSTSLRVLRSAYERVRNYELPWHRRAANKLRLERWGLWREPGFTYAKCECFCEGCCAGLECLGGCGEGAACAADGCGVAETCGGCGGSSCCGDCLCCCPHDFCGQNKKSQSKTAGGSKQGKTLEKLVGKQGLTQTRLSPSGMVEVEGQIYPAESETGAIEAGQSITVVRARTIGVLVRKTT